MLFNSISFLVFFATVFSLYFFVVPHRFRWALLLIASYYFYMSWKVEYIAFIMLSTLTTFYFSKWMYNAKTKLVKKLCLSSVLFVNLGMLFTFKYWNFVSTELAEFLAQFTIQMNPYTVQLLLPVGISFYTFQALSYTLDIYKGKLEPTNHLGKFATFISFFPQLVAGPIERAKDLLPQFNKKVEFEYSRVVEGFRLMLWGLFKKIAIADSISPIVEAAFNAPDEYSAITLAFATFLFAIQIYCDFSGYSDIAIGAAKVFGFKLSQNFNLPYFSTSVSDFWRRWHMSLSTWLRDYVYIPLGGNKNGKIRSSINLLTTFFVSGIWHGANWTYIIWGLYHGFLILIERILGVPNMVAKLKSENKLVHLAKNAIPMAICFILVCLGWILFRADNIDTAMYIIKKIADIDISSSILSNLKSDLLDMKTEHILLKVSLIIFMLLFEYFNVWSKLVAAVNSKHKIFIDVLRWGVYMFIVYIILYYGSFGSREFVYFQF